MSVIRGLKFTYKGGPGSGNIGHAGRAGIHGESDAMSGYGTMLRGVEGWDGLSDEKKREFAAAANGIPNGHIEKLSNVYIANEYLDANEASGMYFPRAGQSGDIYLHSRNSTGCTIAHEVGHHIWHKSVGPLEAIDVDRDRRVAKSLQAESSGRVALASAGLRQYSLTHVKEFWADSYSLWGRANQGNRLAKELQGNYREIFPETTKLLDGLFGG